MPFSIALPIPSTSVLGVSSDEEVGPSYLRSHSSSSESGSDGFVGSVSTHDAGAGATSPASNPGADAGMDEMGDPVARDESCEQSTARTSALARSGSGVEVDLLAPGRTRLIVVVAISFLSQTPILPNGLLIQPYEIAQTMTENRTKRKMRGPTRVL